MGNVDFGTRLKELRKSENETQPMLAEAIGVSRSAISMYESGAREPDFETLEAIADHYNVDMNYLMGWTDDPYDYDLDYDSLFSEIPSDVLAQLQYVYNNDNKQIWKAWLRMHQANQSDAPRKEKPVSYEEDLLKLDHTYLRLAKGAQELGLDDDDVDQILAIYRKHKQKNE